jgi:hypothetical protein
VDEGEGDEDDEEDGREGGGGRGGNLDGDALPDQFVAGSDDDDEDEEEDDELQEEDITLHTAASEEAGPLDGLADGPGGPSEHAQPPPNPIPPEDAPPAASANNFAYPAVGQKRGRGHAGAQPLYKGPRGANNNTARFDGKRGHQQQQHHLTGLHYEVAGFASAAAPGPQDLEAVAAAIHAVQVRALDAVLVNAMAAC